MTRRRISERYVLCEKLGEGGQAVVHYGRLLGQSGFARTVAIKRLNDEAARDPELRAMLIDEAWMASRIRHPNVVSILDVVETKDELFLVMDYVPGLPLSMLLPLASNLERPCPPAVAARIACDVLRGLHAAHEATDARGEPLGLIHRDVSVQNVLVGLDGVPRVLDFGIAKAAGRLVRTKTGVLKGKLAYMAPEQLRSGPLDRRVDVYAAGVVLWELLVGQPLHAGSEQAIWMAILNGRPSSPADRIAAVPRALGEVVLRALAKKPDERYPTAHAMVEAVERTIVTATPTEVGAWVEVVAGPVLRVNMADVAALERRPELDPDEPSFVEASGVEPPVARSPDGARPRSSLTRPVAAAAAACGVAALAAVIALVLPSGAGRVSAAPVTHAPASPATASPASLASPVSATSPGSPASILGSAGAIVADETPAPAASDPTSSAVNAASGARPRSASGRVRARVPAGCETPFVVDANGHKIYQAECIQ